MMPETKRPTFLVIGAYKAGTTSLYYYLRQHPQIYLPSIKEVRYLTYAGHHTRPLTAVELRATPWPVQTLTAYEALFAAAQPHQRAYGEVSPCYLAFPEQSILGIQHYVPHAKLIVILRNPVDRAYSSFINLVRVGREEVRDFRTVIQLEESGKVRSTDGSPRRDLQEGYYFPALNAYYQAFPREQIQVFLYDDWQCDAQGLLRAIFRFVAVDETFQPDLSERYNVATWPRSPRLQQWIQRPHLFIKILDHSWPTLGQRVKARLYRLNMTTPPTLPADLRQQLTDRYRADIIQLEGLIGRDLSHWLTT